MLLGAFNCYYRLVFADPDYGSLMAFRTIEGVSNFQCCSSLFPKFPKIIPFYCSRSDKNEKSRIFRFLENLRKALDYSHSSFFFSFSSQGSSFFSSFFSSQQLIIPFTSPFNYSINSGARIKGSVLRLPANLKCPQERIWSLPAP